MAKTMKPLESLSAQGENVTRAKYGYQVRLDCPDCGDAGQHDTNGDKMDPAFCCRACGMHHDVRRSVEG